MLFLVLSSAAYLVFFYIISKVQNKKHKYILQYIAGNSYPVIVISSMMWLSLVAQQGLANTMSMFLIGMFFVGALWLFSVKEVIMLSLLILVCLYIGLQYYQENHDRLILNYLVGSYILAIFFAISRIVYSYHFNYFTQLKTIEDNNHEISQINKLQTEMLSIAVHDLRGPINSIMTLTDLVKNYASNDEERNEYYEMILAACNDSTHIIQDLIMIAREKSQKIDLAETNINSFLTQLVQNWQHTIPDHMKISLEVPSKQIYGNVDVQKMQRVINNLVSNSIKFTPDDGIITIRLTENNGHMRISVADNGIGIPAHLIPKLFERFSKAGRLGLNGEKSYGLGLSICRQIIEQHGGAIGIESVENVGSTFNIDLAITNTTENGDEAEHADFMLAEEHN
jgi:signal transduction histidine kinase